MHATKRKFNALLQGLSSSPQPPALPDASPPSTGAHLRLGDSPGAHDALLQKRRRLGFPESTAPTIYSPSLTAVVSSIVPKRLTSQARAKPAKDKGALAKYAPGDRDELLRRLATFQELTDWTPKPERVSEIEWAKRGWVCQSKETVRCVLCHKELVVKLNRKDVDGKEVPVLVPSEIEEALVDKYAELMVSSHQQDCLWRRRGCQGSLVRLSFSNSRATLEALRRRYDELCSRASFLPYEFNLRLPQDMRLDDVLLQLPRDLFADAKSPQRTAEPVNRAALALALCGWQGFSNTRIGAVPNTASCHTCLRRLGLWMFKSKQVGQDGQILVPAPMDFLDPLQEHRFFCPWSSAKAQSRGAAAAASDTDSAAWSTLLQAIKNEADLQDVYEGRSKRRSRLAHGGHDTPPATPVRGSVGAAPATPGSATTHTTSPAHDDETDDKARDAKDKERWARLRKVKSLFDTKAAKLRRPLSRPGTASSNKSGA